MTEENAPPPAAPAAGEPPPSPKRKRIKLAIVGVVALAFLAGGVWYWGSTKDIATTDDAQIDGNAVTIMPKISGYIVEMPLVDNQRVKAGTLLLKIDPRDYLSARHQARAALDMAIAQRENAQANLDKVMVSAPAQLLQAKAQRDAAAASQTAAAAQAERQTSVDRKATTQQNIDQALTQAQSAGTTLASNQAQVRIAALVPQAIAQAKAQLHQAEAQVEQAEAQLAAAEINLAHTEIRAPQDGWVTKRNVQLGGYVQAGQSLLALTTPEVWVSANFKENQLDRMRVSQQVTIKVDAYKRLELHGHVDSVQMGTGSRFTAFPAENATGNFVKIVQRVPVKIVIDSGLDPNRPLPLGLSVAPEVALK